MVAYHRHLWNPNSDKCIIRTDLSCANPDWLQLASAFGCYAHKIALSRDL